MDEIRQFCKHLGPSITVHETYYQQLDQSIEKVKVARLLTALDDGSVNDLHGKRIEDIAIEGTREL